MVNFSDIEKAQKNISAFINHTPVLECSTFNYLYNCQIFFKCENFQKTGSFKARGATNAVRTLSENSNIYAFATHSSGNHAAALARAAQIVGKKSFIVMPIDAPKIKVKAVKHYGSEIVFCESSLQSREETLQNVIKETGALFIPPYNHELVISGQGTCCLELLQKVPDLDLIMAPVGGGGLLSGTSIVAKYYSKAVYGAEPELANDAWQSFKAGSLILLQQGTKTIADGLRTSLGDITFSIINKNVDDIFTVSEQAIVKAMRDIWERMKIIIEPSCAVPFAAVQTNPKFFYGKKIGIILSGGNVDLDNLPF